MPKPRCILLDAGPIIGLHELALWDQFTQVFEVVVPEIICEQEALFHSVDSLSGFSEPIRLPKDAEDKRIDVASASGEAIITVNHEVGRFVEIHDGETEALALLTQDTAYAAYSTPRRTLIPRQAEHRFHGKPNSDSTPRRTVS